VGIWVEDFKFHLSRALRVVGIALTTVAWVSVLASEAQQSSDVRTLALVGSALLSVLVTHWFTGLPPSANVVEMVRPIEREIIAAARERAGGDSEHLHLLIARVSALAIVHVRRAGTLPRDRRSWLRALTQAAESSQT
jgi:hypothetical protein